MVYMTQKNIIKNVELFAIILNWITKKSLYCFKIMK
jgi:hypothetical protein